MTAAATVHTDFVEPAELVRDRILYATTVLEQERIEVNPDCGPRTRSWKVAYEKLVRMVEGTRLAEPALAGGRPTRRPTGPCGIGLVTPCGQGRSMRTR